MQIPLLFFLVICLVVVLFLVLVGGGELISAMAQVATWILTIIFGGGAVWVTLHEIHQAYGWPGIIGLFVGLALAVHGGRRFLRGSPLGAGEAEDETAGVPATSTDESTDANGGEPKA